MLLQNVDNDLYTLHVQGRSHFENRFYSIISTAGASLNLPGPRTHRAQQLGDLYCAPCRQPRGTPETSLLHQT